MNKEFIPYEQALELKELGFDEECLAYYHQDQMLEIDSLGIKRDHYRGKFGVLAPLYQQAFRWFREKHGLYHFIGLDVMNMSSLDAINKFAFKTAIFNSKMDGYDAGNYKSFEEAELSCLKKLIQIV